MRFSIASVAIMAGLVAAVPQYSIQPISQISDGQIQAPPATSVAVPEVPGASETPVASQTPVASETPMSSGAMVPSMSDMTSTVAGKFSYYSSPSLVYMILTQHYSH